MARRRTGGGVAEALAQNLQLADPDLQLVRLGRELGAVDPRPSVGREHVRNLVERKAGGATERDQGQPLKDFRIEQAAQASPADRGDQPLLLIIAKRRGGNAGTGRDLGNINVTHPIDLKST